MPKTQLRPLNGYAIWYDKRTYPLRYLQFHRHILEGLKGSAKTDINLVDVGCSTGHATYELKRFLEEHSYKVTTIGIDCDHGVLQEAYASGRIDHPIRAVAQDLSAINDKSIDVVVCNSLIEYFPSEDFLKANQQFRRILTDDGVLATNNHYPLSNSIS